MLKAILFDIDETLLDWSGQALDWESYERERIGRVFDYVNAHVHPLANRDRFFIDTLDYVYDLWAQAKQTGEAPHLGYALLDTLERHGVPRQSLSMADCLAAYDGQAVPGVKPYADVIPALRYLKAQNLRFGLVTNSLHPMQLRDIELADLGLAPFFEDGCRFSAADVGYLKPHPHIFQAALECLNVSAEEVVLVGDSLPADIVGAKRLGIKAILRYREDPLHYTPTQAVQEMVPDATIHRLDELYPILDSWFEGWR